MVTFENAIIAAAAIKVTTVKIFAEECDVQYKFSTREDLVRQIP